MEIKFDKQQQHQIDAVNAICDLFCSQPSSSGALSTSLRSFDEDCLFTEFGISNDLQISESKVLENLQKVQERQSLPVSQILNGMNFSIEMETGTGKTYVYLRTIYELSLRYGFKKFIIVVPSVAIREGVKKTIELTKKHFSELYDNIPCESWIYDSSKLSSIRQFAVSDQIQIMIINIDSFNKDSNIINNEQESLSGKKPIDFLRACNPIVIIDEPQSIESELAHKAIASLSPLCTLRFSATHRVLYNIVYRLTPVQAYDLKLVKHIEVDSILDESDYNQPFICIQEIKATKNSVSAKVLIDVKNTTGIKRKAVSIKKSGIDLLDLSGGREAYRGYIVQEIDAENGYIVFSNGVELSVGESQGKNQDEIMKAQIKETVKEHFEKELLVTKLYSNGPKLKVLSLFFIDKVANYVPEDGKIRIWFVSAYEECRKMKRYSQLDMPPVDSVHGGYFSISKGKAKDTSGNTKADDEIYELIMKDKERLLSLSEPLRFIFSHSALREGWDNPNVFQICTLNDTKSEIKKRQEIGRGLRLPVNELGERCFDEHINRLTVVANESYESFASQLQTEIEEDTGMSFRGKIENKKERQAIRLIKGWENNLNFIKLWESINQKANYLVSYDTEELVSMAVTKINDELNVSQLKLKAKKAKLDIGEEGISSTLQAEKEIEIKSESEYFPDLIGYLQRETELTRHTLARILMGIDRLADVLINPQEFLDQVLKILNDVKTDLMLKGLKYEKQEGKAFDISLFNDECLSGYLSKMIAVKKSIYDYIEFDSEIERIFAAALDSREDVKCFIKLPSWYLIDTPIGSYNPDWAIIKQKDDESPRLVLVRETKGTTDERFLRKSEVEKIHCGQKFFALLGVDYKTIVSANDL